MFKKHLLTKKLQDFQPLAIPEATKGGLPPYCLCVCMCALCMAVSTATKSTSSSSRMPTRWGYLELRVGTNPANWHFRLGQLCCCFWLDRSSLPLPQHLHSAPHLHPTPPAMKSPPGCQPHYHICSMCWRVEKVESLFHNRNNHSMRPQRNNFGGCGHDK